MSAHAKKAELYSEYDETSFEAAIGREAVSPLLSTASETLRRVLMSILRSAKTPEEARTGMNAAIAEYRTFAEKTIAMIPLTAFKSDENPNGTDKPDVNKQVAQILTAVKSDFEKEFGEDKPAAETTEAKKTDTADTGEKTEAKKGDGDKGASGEAENNKQDDGKANTTDAKKSEDGKDEGDKTNETSAKKEDKEPHEKPDLEAIIASAVAKAVQPMAEQLAAVSKQVDAVGSRVEKAETTLKSATVGGRSNEDTVRKSEDQPKDDSFSFDTASGRRP